MRQFYTISEHKISNFQLILQYVKTYIFFYGLYCSPMVPSFQFIAPLSQYPKITLITTYGFFFFISSQRWTPMGRNREFEYLRWGFLWKLEGRRIPLLKRQFNFVSKNTYYFIGWLLFFQVVFTKKNPRSYVSGSLEPNCKAKCNFQCYPSSLNKKKH